MRILPRASVQPSKAEAIEGGICTFQGARGGTHACAFTFSKSIREALERRTLHNVHPSLSAGSKLLVSEALWRRSGLFNNRRRNHVIFKVSPIQYKAQTISARRTCVSLHVFNSEDISQGGHSPRWHSRATLSGGPQEIHGGSSEIQLDVRSIYVMHPYIFAIRLIELAHQWQQVSLQI